MYIYIYTYEQDLNIFPQNKPSSYGGTPLAGYHNDPRSAGNARRFPAACVVVAATCRARVRGPGLKGWVLADFAGPKYMRNDQNIWLSEKKTPAFLML